MPENNTNAKNTSVVLKFGGKVLKFGTKVISRLKTHVDDYTQTGDVVVINDAASFTQSGTEVTIH